MERNIPEVDFSLDQLELHNEDELTHEEKLILSLLLIRKIRSGFEARIEKTFINRVQRAYSIDKKTESDMETYFDRQSQVKMEDRGAVVNIALNMGISKKRFDELWQLLLERESKY